MNDEQYERIIQALDALTYAVLSVRQQIRAGQSAMSGPGAGPHTPHAIGEADRMAKEAGSRLPGRAAS